jgi:hypothetical protein
MSFTPARRACRRCLALTCKRTAVCEESAEQSRYQRMFQDLAAALRRRGTRPQLHAFSDDLDRFRKKARAAPVPVPAHGLGHAHGAAVAPLCLIDDDTVRGRTGMPRSRGPKAHTDGSMTAGRNSQMLGSRRPLLHTAQRPGPAQADPGKSGTGLTLGGKRVRGAAFILAASGLRLSLLARPDCRAWLAHYVQLPVPGRTFCSSTPPSRAGQGRTIGRAPSGWPTCCRCPRFSGAGRRAQGQAATAFSWAPVAESVGR